MTKIEELEADLRLMRGIWERQKDDADKMRARIAELVDKCNRLLHEKKVSGYSGGGGGSSSAGVGGIYHGSGSESMGAVRVSEVAEFARISAERAKLRELMDSKP